MSATRGTVAYRDYRSTVPGIDWLAFPGPAGARLAALQWQLERTQWLSADALAQARWRQLLAVARHAARHSPYYRARFAAAGLDPERGFEPAQYARLALTHRSDVQSQWDALQCAQVPAEHGAIHLGHTSGSTGRPLPYRVSTACVTMWQALAVRDHLWQARDLYAHHAMIDDVADEEERSGWDASLDTLYFSGRLSLCPLARDIGAQFDWLMRKRPRYLLLKASALRDLVLLGLERGKRPQRLAQVRTWGAPLDAQTRALVAEAWGVPVIDYYSCREAGPLALQCPRHDHLHVQAESVLLEVLDDTGQPCAPGQTGRVVISTLHNFAMPLLRYAIGDYAEVGAACDCGRSLPVIARVRGRERNSVRLPDGRRFWPSFGTMERIVGLRLGQWQVRQVALDRIRVDYVADRTLDAADTEQIVAWAHRQFHYPFNVACVRVDSLAAPNGKFEDFVCELTPSDAGR